MTSVAIIDDHTMVRRGVEYVLKMQKGEFAFVGELGGGAGAAEFVRSTKPDVLLLDIRMPDRDGIDVLRDVIAARPEQKVIMLTTSNADNDVYEAINVGAKGYLMKDRDSDDLVRAIRVVAEGGTFLSKPLRELYNQRHMLGGLTQRERDVLELVAKGFTVDGIASLLKVTGETVKSHMKSIYAKLDVNDKVSAVTEAYRRGFLRRD